MEFGCWTLRDILEDRYFRVPDYQRGFAWGNRQLQEFWEDLCAVMQSGCRHYTGAITVEALQESTDFESRKGFYVVDGQQRLTTIAILFSTLELEDNPFVVGGPGEVRYVFSYGGRNDDLQFLNGILSGDDSEGPSNSHQRNLLQAREFFRAKMEGYDVDRKRQVANTLMTCLTFDFRVLGSDYNSGIVFETMNNRGKPLTLLEKLKNRLMYLVSTIPFDGEEESREMFEDDKTTLRTEIEEVWGDIYRALASNPESDPLDEDEYVAAHLSVYRAPKESVYSKSVAESRLFKMFCSNAERYPKSERIDEDDIDAVVGATKEEKVTVDKIRKYVEDVAAFAKPWAEIHKRRHDALGRCMLLSRKSEVKIFLATVFLHVEDELTRDAIFKDAGRIIYRNTVKSIMDEVRFATLARQLHGKCQDMLRRGERECIDADGVKASLRATLDDERCKLNADILIDYFTGLMSRQQSPYGFYGWTGLKYFLFMQEELNAGHAMLDYGKMTLEHVMPQSATVDNDDGWWVRQMREFTMASGFGDWNDLSDNQRRECRQCKRNLVNSLGNFVLLTQSENAAVSDDPWEGYPAVAGSHNAVIGKKAFYSDSQHVSSSGARKVAELEGAWNAFRIRERGRGLFKELARSLGVEEVISDERIDLALGFCDVELKDSFFDSLADEEVNRLAPRLGTAAEDRNESHNAIDVNVANVAFWEGFRQWCQTNNHNWCSAAVAPRGNPYYDPQGGGACHLFFVFGKSSGNIRGNGPLVTVGIYCANGEEQRSQIRNFKGELDTAFADCPFDFQDWESGTRQARRILFVRRADYRNPTEELYERMANDYEKISSILRRRGML